MSNARTFEAELMQEFDDKEDEMRAYVVEVAHYLADQVVQRSPVDTGRFVANWNAAIGVPDVHTSAHVDPGKTNTAERLKRKISEFKNVTTWPKIFLTEALPYARRLEGGWSKQAPQGVVGVSLANAVAKYSRARVI